MNAYQLKLINLLLSAYLASDTGLKYLVRDLALNGHSGYKNYTIKELEDEVLLKSGEIMTAKERAEYSQNRERLQAWVMDQDTDTYYP